MADIELVIKIPKRVYNYIRKYEHIANSDILDIKDAVINGTPLSKNRGRLLDENEINTVVDGVFNVFDKYSPKTFLDVIHEQCIEVVRADRIESEG